MITDAPTPEEQDLALWLWECDEAIAAGRSLPPCPANHSLEADELACLKLLDGLRGPRLTTHNAESPIPNSEAEPTFVAVVRALGVIEPSVLEDHLERWDFSPSTSPRQVADGFVESGLLTRYQVDCLLTGRQQLILSGRYCIWDRLGAGGMGEVFLCSHLVMKHKVAIKILPASRAADASSLERFRREARAAASLDHPNIVRAYDIDSDGSTHYLVMEYVSGITLADIVKTQGPLSIRMACEMVCQVAGALQHAYERGLVHRDIKPSNLIQDSTGVVKVLDLGLARFFYASPEGSDTEDDGLVVGTADYMAPEQSFDSPSADTRADIYSLGCTLYFLLTGKAPFQDKSVARKLLCHQFRKPEPLRTIRPEVPLALSAIVDRMTAKDPVDRYQTPREIVAALQTWVAPARPSLWSRHNQTVAACMIAMLCIVIPGLLIFGMNPYLKVQPENVTTDRHASSEIDHVIARLQERNPNFDGQLGGFSYTSVENQQVVPPLRVVEGRVIDLSLCTDAITDISPLSELKSLQTLTLRGSGDKKGRLKSLEPLRGLPLVMIDCTSNPDITDFTPLQGMPLERFTFGGTGIRDLSQLQGLPLKHVFAGNTRIRDLLPLSGMQLTKLSVRHTQVSDLEPIRGMPLELLRCEGSKVRDLSPLSGSPLKVLSCRGLVLPSMLPIVDCPLVELEFDFKPTRDAELPNLLSHVQRINGQPASQFWANNR